MKNQKRIAVAGVGVCRYDEVSLALRLGKLMTQHDQHIAAWRDAFRDETTGIHRTIQDLLWNYAASVSAVPVMPPSLS